MKGTIAIDIDDSSLTLEQWQDLLDDIEEAVSNHTANYDIDSSFTEANE